MDDKQLERVRDYALGGGIEGDGHPLNPLDADLAAMHTPITAETLSAAGWKHKAAFDDIFAVDEFALGGVRVRIGGGLIAVGVAGRRFDGVSNMYDLRELVRLLGGAA